MIKSFILFNILYKKRKKGIKKSYAVQHGDLFTPEKFIKINDNTAKKYLISIIFPIENYSFYPSGRIIINCYKKNNG